MDYIKLNGKDHPFWYAVKAQREASKLPADNDKDQIYFIWLGLKYGIAKNNRDQKLNETLELTENELENILDDNVQEYLDASVLLNEQSAKLLVVEGK